MGISTIAAAVSAIGSAFGVVKSLQKSPEEKRLKKQQKKAEETARLDETRLDTGADIRLGSAEEEDETTDRRQRGRRSISERAFTGGLGSIGRSFTGGL